MQISLSFAFFCHFLAGQFHTLKIESDFFSRQGHCTLCWTGVYQSLLLKKQQRRSSFLFFLENGILLFFVVSLCWNLFYSFLHRKEMLINFKICCDDIKHRREKQNKETKQLQKNNCCWYSLLFSVVLCICTLLLPKFSSWRNISFINQYYYFY